MLWAGYAVRGDNKDRQDKRLIFDKTRRYDIPRSLIHESKQAHYACNWFTSSLVYITTAYHVPRSQLLKKPHHLEFIFSAYRAPRSQLHKIHRRLEFIFSAYRVPRSQLNKIHRNLEFIFSAYRAPHSQPFSVTHSMWRSILQLLRIWYKQTKYQIWRNSAIWLLELKQNLSSDSRVLPDVQMLYPSILWRMENKHVDGA